MTQDGFTNYKVERGVTKRQVKSTVPEISSAELKNGLNSGKEYQLLDVRSKHEFIDGALLGAYQIPLDELAGRTTELVTDMETITICGSGHRSKQALQILQARGFKKVRSLAGGMDVWLSLIVSLKAQ